MPRVRRRKNVVKVVVFWGQQDRFSTRKHNIMERCTGDRVHGVDASMGDVASSKLVVHVDVGDESNHVARRGIDVTIKTKNTSVSSGSKLGRTGVFVWLETLVWEGLCGKIAWWYVGGQGEQSMVGMQGRVLGAKRVIMEDWGCVAEIGDAQAAEGWAGAEPGVGLEVVWGDGGEGGKEGGGRVSQRQRCVVGVWIALCGAAVVLHIRWAVTYS